MPKMRRRKVGPGPDANLIWPERHVKFLFALIAVMVLLGFSGWAFYVRQVAIRPPPPGTINVVSATFGGNCGASKNNVQQWVQSACSGKQQCDLVFDWRFTGNPAPTCNKNFNVEWNCSPNGPAHSLVLPSDPPQGTVIPLTCR